MGVSGLFALRKLELRAGVKGFGLAGVFVLGLSIEGAIVGFSEGVFESLEDCELGMRSAFREKLELLQF